MQLLRSIGRRLLGRPKTEPGKKKTDPAKVAQAKEKDPLVEKYKREGDYEVFRSLVVTLTEAGIISTPAVVAFAKEAVFAGRPEDVVSLIPSLPPSAFRSKAARASIFSALLMKGETEAANAFALETLATRSLSKREALPMIADAHIASPALTAQVAKVFVERFADQAEPLERLFVANSVLNRCGFDTMLDLGLPGPLMGVPEKDAAVFRSNLARLQNRWEEQVDWINQSLGAHGLFPVGRVSDDAPLSADNIRPLRDPVAVTGGPKVTVFMASYNAEDRIERALAGILGQDYQNLEVLVVDDASSDGTVDTVHRIAQADARVTLVRAPSNGGAYKARNIGLRAATGELFVTNDSDDWAHPQRISTLVRLLQSHPDAVAAYTGLYRISPDAGIKPKIKGYAHPDASSLMYWREKVVAALGCYDENRFGADSEFIARVEMAFGRKAIASLNAPLLFAHWAPNTLSGSSRTGITDGGLFAPARARYRFDYRERHRKQPSPFRSPSVEV